MPTLVDAMNSSKLLVRLGDGGGSEVFTHPCLINTSRGIEFSTSPTESLVPYCSPDEDKAGWVDREVDSKSAAINGAGVLDTKSLNVFWAWWDSGLSKNIQVAVNVLQAEGGGYWSGAAILQSFTVTGPGRREKVTFDCSIMSDGPWIWTAA